MKTEVQYRTFDELLDSVRIDFKGLDLDGMIEPQEMLKVAIRVNRELGLKVNPMREKCIDIKDGKARLPEDFFVMNLALVCDGDTKEVTMRPQKSMTDELLEVLIQAKNFIASSRMEQHVITMTINPGVNIIPHPLKTKDVIIQAVSPEGNLLGFDYTTVSYDEVSLFSEAAEPLENIKVIIVGKLGWTPADEYTQAQLSEDTHNKPIVKYVRANSHGVYNRVVALEMVPHRQLANECVNTRVKSIYKASLKSNFLHTNFANGVVYLSYISLMEDDDGNLLVMDHPVVNEYYEYAIKERILENLFMNGEPNVQARLQMVQQKLRMARNNAMSYVNTPDFRELKRVWELNRTAQYHNYYNMFL